MLPIIPRTYRPSQFYNEFIADVIKLKLIFYQEPRYKRPYLAVLLPLTDMAKLQVCRRRGPISVLRISSIPMVDSRAYIGVCNRVKTIRRNHVSSCEDSVSLHRGVSFTPSVPLPHCPPFSPSPQGAAIHQNSILPITLTPPYITLPHPPYFYWVRYPHLGHQYSAFPIEQTKHFSGHSHPHEWYTITCFL